MAGETYEQNLMRACAAYLQLQCQMTAAREMFSKSYFALGQPEKIAVDQAVLGLALANFQVHAREHLNPEKRGAGFLSGMATAPAEAPGEPVKAE